MKKIYYNPLCPVCDGETFCNSGDARFGGIFTCRNNYCRYCFEWRPDRPLRQVERRDDKFTF